MTVVLGAYLSTLAIWSHSIGTTKFPAVMTMGGRYSNIKSWIPSCPLLPCFLRARVGGLVGGVTQNVQTKDHKCVIT